MVAEGVTTEPLIDVDRPPAPSADEQKLDEAPAPAAEEQNAETETPEQTAAKQESRRAGQRARQRAAQAAALASAQTEAKMLREQLAKANTQSVAGEPKREQYTDYEVYLEARADWRAKQAAEGVLRTDREARQGREAAAGQEKVAQDWTKREKTFQATTKDYSDVVTPYVETDIGQLSKEARAVIVESEVGPQLLYTLANTDEHERISALSPARQAAELVLLEKKFAPNRESKAPPPVTRLNPGRSAPNGYSENMSPAEYSTWRKSQGARWAR